MKETVYYFQTPISIALLADSHNSPIDEVICSLKVNKPEIICFCGDAICGVPSKDYRSPLEKQLNGMNLLKACVSISPTFFSLGNHEWILEDKDIQIIKQLGVMVLDDEWVERDGLIIGGLTSGYCIENRRQRYLEPDIPCYNKSNKMTGIGGILYAKKLLPNLTWIDNYVQRKGYHILLNHHPEYWNYLRDRRIELVLSGHAHGGQWRLFGRGLFAPGQGLFPRYTSGLYENHLIVSRGLSDHSRIPRLFNSTEIVYIQPEK